MSINNIAANANENTNAANPPKELSSEAHKYIKSILGANTDLSISEIMEMLNQVYLSTSKEKKKNDLVKKYIDDINFITKSQENLAIYKNNKERVYLTYLKPDVKTKMYNAVKDEHLSPTLFAYYNCDRNRKVLSDKEAATMRAMKIDNNLDFTDENIAFNPFKGKKEKEANKDFDVISQSSFSHINFASASDPNTPYLRKKRQYSMKKKDPKKIGRSGKKSNTDKAEPNKNNRNGNDSDCEDEKDKEYCIHNCVFKRKYNGDNEMIGCDSCVKWYHPKCIGMSNEEVQNNIDIDWFCNECKSRKR